MAKKQIAKTKDYAQFKSILGNRQLSKEHIHELTVEIQRNNLLDVCPIIVNDKFQVIDGQHRLEAAKQLGIEVPYVVVPGLGIEHVVRMNTSQKKWTMSNYIQLHIDLGNQHYIDLAEFVKEHKITPHQGIALLSSSQYLTTKLNDFREGRWEVTRYDEALEVVNVMKQLMPIMRTNLIYRNNAFASAVVKTMSILEQNSDDNEHGGLFYLTGRIENTTATLSFSHRVRDYLKELEDIINYGRKRGLIRLV
jgi:hypothetical protein